MANGDRPKLPPVPAQLNPQAIPQQSLDLRARVSELEGLLEKAYEQLAHDREVIQAMQAPPLRYGVVNHLGDVAASEDPPNKTETFSTFGVAFNDGDVLYLPAIREVAKNLAIGSTVLVDMRTYTIIKRGDRIQNFFKTTVGEVLDGDRVVIKVGNREKIILSGGKEILRGDHVAVDPAHTVVLENLGRRSNRYFDRQVPDLTWDQVIGQEKVITEVRRSLVRPFTNPEIYKKFPNTKPPKGGLLYGASGVGKTMIGKAIAHEIGAGEYFYICGSELLRTLVGEGEGIIRDFFTEGREKARTSGKPVVLFVDEAEILKKRGTGISSDAHDSLVSQWLKETDGQADNQNLLIILATNRLDIMDEAVIRPERMNIRIEVRRPDQQGFTKTIETYLSGHPLQEGTAEEMAKTAAAAIYNNRHPVAEVIYESGDKDTVELKHLLSGALAKSIVTRARDLAIDDDFDTDHNRYRNDPRVSVDNLFKAINAEYLEITLNSITRDDYLRVAEGKTLRPIREIIRVNTPDRERMRWGLAVPSDPDQPN